MMEILKQCQKSGRPRALTDRTLSVQTHYDGKIIGLPSRKGLLISLFS